MNQSRLSALVILGFALALPTTATSATLQVANTGTDSPACGATPCRSIGQAIAHAASGDTILVGPALYNSELDRDGVRSEPGARGR